MTSTSATTIPTQAAPSVHAPVNPTSSQLSTPSANTTTALSGNAASAPAARPLSYSQAAGKKIPAIVSSNPAQSTQSPVASSPVAGGNNQNARPNTNASPVNGGGKPSILPAVPAVVPGPTVVNGSSKPGGYTHSRSASLATGGSVRMPGQQPPTPSSIQFGSFSNNANPSTGTATPSIVPPAVPSGTLNASAGPISPAASPAPTTQPAASGGPPPQLPRSGMPVFGSTNETPDQSRNAQGRPMSMPPTAPNGQVHARQNSSHGNDGPPNGIGRGGMGQNRSHRGGPQSQGSYGASFSPHQGHQQPFNANFVPSTAPNRGTPYQGRGGGVMGSPYSGNAHIAYQNNNRGVGVNRSPALSHSVPTTPNMPNAQLAGNNAMPSPSFAFAQHLQPGQHMSMPQGPMYNQHQQFDPSFYPPQQLYGYQQGHYMGPQPGSPRPQYQMPQGASPYMQQGYGQHPGNMSRSNSQISEQHIPRPPSSMSHMQGTPTLAAAQLNNPNNPPPLSHPGPTLDSPSTSGSNTFKKPQKNAVKLTITDPVTGKPISFGPPAASPAPAQKAPVIVSSSPAPGHDRNLSRGGSKPFVTNTSTPTGGKSAEQIREDTIAAVKLKIEADKADEKAAKDAVAKRKEDDEKATKAAEAARIKKEEDDAAAAKAAKEKEEEDARLAKEAESKVKADEEERVRKEEELKKQQEEEKVAKEKEEADRVAKEKAAKEAEAEAKAAEEKAALDQSAKNLDPLTREVVDDAANSLEKASKPVAPDAKAIEELASNIAKISVSQIPPSPTEDSAAVMKTVEKSRKPAPLNLQLKTSTEPAMQSAALTALRSARFIDDINGMTYPTSILSPNPALNSNAPMGKFKYDKDFLMQFQTVFTEKPSVDWDNRMRDTVGESESARPQSARAPSSKSSMGGPRSGMGPPAQMGSFGSIGKMGSSNIMSAQGRQPSNSFQTLGNPMGGMSNFRPAPIVRTGSTTTLSSQSNMTPQSPGGGRNRSLRSQSTKKSQGPSGMENRMDSKRQGGREQDPTPSAPLLAASDIKPLVVSEKRWQPRSVAAAAAAAAPTPGGDTGEDNSLPPEMVQRKVKAALNKMTPEKFDKIADQILEIASQSRNESDGRSLRQVIQLTFEKATDEPHWASMYAKFCKRMLDDMGPDIKDENIKDKHGAVVTGGALFRKYLLNRCQEEFERGWKVNLPPKPEGVSDEAVMLSDEYYVAMTAKRRGLGLIQFIGELFKLSMLTERIMHECMKKLVDYEGIPEEEEVESLVKLLRTIGSALDSTEKSKPMMDVYFGRITQTMEAKDLPSRLKFMLLDIIELRKAGWNSKEDNKGPKTIQEIREDALKAAQEKEAANARVQSNRRPPGGRGDARSFSQGFGNNSNNNNNMGYGGQDHRQTQTLNSDELRRLGTKSSAARNPISNTFGPSSMFASARSSSGGSRKGLGPSLSDSLASSRTGTPVAKPAESVASTNSFSALSQSFDQADVPGEAEALSLPKPTEARAPSPEKPSA